MEITFVGIPFYTLARYRGMGEAVKNLRVAGLLQQLSLTDEDLTDIGDVNCPHIDRDRGPRNLLNFDEFLEGTRRVKDKLSSGIDPSTVTFCLGGECSFVVGSLAGLKSIYKGKPGIVWLDAHGDFNTPETTPSGFIGGMPLAFACGRGPRLSQDLKVLRPLLDEKRVVHVGSRALDPGEDKTMRGSVYLFPANEVKKKGAATVARQVSKLLSDSCDWIIAHLDVDVLDPSIMPSVNYPEPGGLTQTDVLAIFNELQSTGKLRVVDLTAYNPSKDPEALGKSLLLELAPRLVNQQ